MINSKQNKDSSNRRALGVGIGPVIKRNISELLPTKIYYYTKPHWKHVSLKGPPEPGLYRVWTLGSTNGAGWCWSRYEGKAGWFGRSFLREEAAISKIHAYIEYWDY